MHETFVQVLGGHGTPCRLRSKPHLNVILEALCQDLWDGRELLNLIPLGNVIEHLRVKATTTIIAVDKAAVYKHCSYL